MKILADWGFNKNWWRGERGEYWVIAQTVLIISFTLLPTYRPETLAMTSPIWQYTSWFLTAKFGIWAAILLGRSLFDLGHNLTPLPHPRDDAQLVQTGIYGLVRHPLYSGVIYLALSWASWLMSLSHLLGAIALFIFFDTKATQEEAWLSEKFPDYANYRSLVKKLIPWFY